MEATALSGQRFLESVCGYSLWQMQKQQALGQASLSDNEDVLLTVKQLELLCTSKYGFLTQVSRNVALQQSEIAVPNIFDSAFIVCVLNSSGIKVPVSIKAAVKTLLLENQDESGMWSYFHSDFKILPVDIDTSSFAILALQACGVCETFLLDMATKLYRSTIFHKDGLPDTFMSQEGHHFEDNNNVSSPVPLNFWKSARRVDIGIVTTWLYMLNKIGIEHLPALTTCYTFLQSVLQDVVDKGDENILLSQAKYYNNIDLLCYLISRLIPVSNLAKSLLQETLCSLVLRRMTSKGTNTVSTACLILAAVNCQVYPSNVDKKVLEEQVQHLQSMRSEHTYMFPKYGWYNGHKGLYYFGSEAISTCLASAAINEVSKLLKL